MDSATNTDSTPRSLVVMGVAGCGKSSLGQAVAHALGWTLLEGDDFHAPESVAKMRAGVALDDSDREGWLDRLGEQLRGHPEGVVLTCSALRQRYRDRLRAASPGLRFAFLDLDQATAFQRVASRPGHLFPPSLVASQFATLEPPLAEPGVLRVDARLPLERLCAEVVDWLAAGGTTAAVPVPQP
ncbi:gluconokinase [Aquabacterium sp. A7-Y]|uniref:gluconokinase n=1 Tax=Aquabacterium sp. A7-Y TaxID=1349605 RepID=UPI00223D910F|nr:gluconokinase [Aquabacterium sp. A7-Y]MCW7539208.1 gluconokinase [Aquabacterium sp. A7-Y]